MATDWVLIRKDWVNDPTLTFRDLAEKYGVKEGTARQRANRENWEFERTAIAKSVTEKVTEAIAVTRAEQLIKLNEEDLKLARALKGKAVEIMRTKLNASELRSIASTIEAAQKIARLALGVETAHTINTNRELPASVDDFV